MLECPARLEPNSLLGVFVVEEEPVVVGVAEAFDFGQTLADLRTSVDHGGLKKRAEISKLLNLCMHLTVYY